MPTAMIEPMSDTTLIVVPVSASAQRMPMNAPGTAIMMMNGSSHDWNITTIRRYTSRDRHDEPETEEPNACVHYLALPANRDRHSRRQLAELRDLSVDAAHHRAEIARLRRSRRRRRRAARCSGRSRSAPRGSIGARCSRASGLARAVRRWARQSRRRPSRCLSSCPRTAASSACDSRSLVDFMRLERRLDGDEIVHVVASD